VDGGQAQQWAAELRALRFWLVCRHQERSPGVEHEGAWQGFETQISRFVDDKLTVVVPTNLDDAKPEVFADRVVEMYLSGTVK
jgi:hypothetical protein